MVGRGSFIDEMLGAAGAENLAAEFGSPYPRGGREWLLEAAPEVILLPDEPYAFGPIDAGELARLGVPAALDGRIHCIDGTWVSWYGPRIREAVEMLCGLLAPLDPVAEK